MLRTLLRFLTKYNTPRWMVLLIDIYLVCNTFVLAYLIRFNFKLNFEKSQLFFQAPIIAIAALVSFLTVGSYKGVVRRTGVKDAFNVALASVVFGTTFKCFGFHK